MRETVASTTGCASMSKRPASQVLISQASTPHPLSKRAVTQWLQINSQYAQVKLLAARGHLDFADLVLLTMLQRNASGPGSIRSATGASAAQISRRVRKLVALDLVTEEVDAADLCRTRLEATSKSYNVIHEVGKALGSGVLEDLFDFWRILSEVQLALGFSELAARVMLSLCLSDTPPRVGHPSGAAHPLDVGRPLDIGQIAQTCAASRSSVSSAVDALERRDFVRKLRVHGKVHDEAFGEVHDKVREESHERAGCRDGRFVMVSLTDEGRKAIEPWVPDLL